MNKDKNGKKEIVHRHGTTKAEKGHFDKAGVSSKRFVREFKFENAEEFTLAQEIKADIFAVGDLSLIHISFFRHYNEKTWNAWRNFIRGRRRIWNI